MKEDQKVQALQNFANKFNLSVSKHFTQDKRKKTKFLISKGDQSVSNPFTYQEANAFLIGILRTKKFNL